MSKYPFECLLEIIETKLNVETYVGNGVYNQTPDLLGFIENLQQTIHFEISSGVLISIWVAIQYRTFQIKISKNSLVLDSYWELIWVIRTSDLVLELAFSKR